MFFICSLFAFYLVNSFFCCTFAPAIRWVCARDALRIEFSLGVSPTRPAPSELPQVLIEARVRGCSGAM